MARVQFKPIRAGKIKTDDRKQDEKKVKKTKTLESSESRVQFCLFKLISLRTLKRLLDARTALFQTNVHLNEKAKWM